MKTKRISRLAITAIGIMSVALPASALELKEVVSQVNETREVVSAQLALAVALKAADLARHPGDLTAGLQPNVSVSTPVDGSFAEEVRLSASASVTVPLALSSAQRAALDRAEDAVSEAELSVERAVDEARYKLALLYQQAWLAQAERAVLEIELTTARQVAANNERLFESGLISLGVLTASRDAVTAAEGAYLENTRDVRIRWLALAYAANLDPELTAELVSPALDLRTLPPPPELTRWALQADRTIAVQTARIDALEREIAEPVSDGILGSVRASFSGASHNVSASYNFSSASLTGNYSFPIVTLGGSDSTSGSPVSDSWDLGLSVSLAYQTKREESLEREILLAELESAKQELAFLEDVVALQVREKHQQLLLAEGTVEQATTAVSTARDNLEMVEKRLVEDRATRVEVLVAETRLARAEFALTSAKVKRDELKLAAAAYAGYVSEIWNETEDK